MNEQVTIRDEDFQRVRDLSDRLRTSLDETVAKALRELDDRTCTQDGLDPAQRAEFRSIRALVAEARTHI